MSLDELSQDPFDVDEFVERLAWRSNKVKTIQTDHSHGESSESGDQGSTAQPQFDPMILHGAFCQTIQQLTEYGRRLDKQVKVLESQCIEEEAQQRKKVHDLLKENQHAFQNFQELDERINFVATKVVHLGDQLESVNVPKARNVEALHMMKYLDLYFSEREPNLDDLLNDPTRLEEAAELMQKLHLIAQELPTAEAKFERAKNRVDKAYNDIEVKLMDGFLRAFNFGEIAEMKRICDILRNFKCYNDLIDKFITVSQQQRFGGKDMLADVQQLCLSTSDIVTMVFFNAENVMIKFVTNVYTGMLKTYIDGRLQLTSGTDNTERYLNTLSQLYHGTTKLSDTLADKLKLGGDTTFLMKLTKINLFGKYLDTYVSKETEYLHEKTSTTLAKYYESRNHSKKQLQAGGFSDVIRGIQAKTHINIGPDLDSYSGEVFLSQEVAITILQEFKLAYIRCKNLVSSKDLPQHATDIYQILTQYLCSEFVDYAIELALYHCPLAESKVAPHLHFLSVVSDASAIVHLFEKQFADSLWPIVVRTSQQEECAQVKTSWMEKYELKLDLGLERTLGAVCGYVKHLLSSEQKRSDFRPDTTEISMMHSPACAVVVGYITSTVNSIKAQLDGKNLQGMLVEFGFRLHKIIYEHLLQYQYDSIGAMLAICDVNEYRTCIKQLASEPVIQLFDMLHSMCNLLVVPPDNLRQVCMGEPLSLLDKNILNSFIQLRLDYKTSKLANLLGR